MPQIEPSCPQYDYMMAEDPFPAFVAGFGAGKTEVAVLRSIIGKLAYPTLNRGFYEPTYDLVRMIAFPRFEEVLTHLGIPYKLYKSPLNYIDIHGYGKIFFRSMDAPARIIGYEHADADVDELDTLKTKDAGDVWRRILSRNRQKKPDGKANTIGVTTTPEGFRFVYQTWKQSPRDGYRIIQAPTESNKHLPAGYVDSLRAIYPEALLQAYLMGEFVNLTSGTVYHTFSRQLNATEAMEQRGEHLHVGIDFNVQNMSAVVHVIRDGDPLAVGELTGVLDTPAIIDLLKDRYRDHKITVYPDASGKGRKTVDASTNDLALLRQAGFSVQVDNANPSVRDRVLAMCSAFSNSKGERKYRVNVKRCPEYTACLEQQAYDKHGAPDKTQGLDHACFSGDTIVTTRMGDFRFDEIPENGEVLGPYGGFVPYQLAGKTGYKNTIKITFADGYVIKCTHDHKFLTRTGKWVQAKDLMGQECVLSAIPGKTLMGADSIFAATTIKRQAGKAKGVYTALFGAITLAKYPKASISITRTKIAQTIKLKIWNAFQGLSMCRFTAQRLNAASEWRKWHQNTGTLQADGILPKKVPNGIGSNTKKPKTLYAVQKALYAAAAALSSMRQFLQRAAQTGTVQRRAKLMQEGRAGLTTKLEHAESAAASSMQTSTVPVKTVISVSPLGEQSVYCLTVPSYGCFRLSDKSPVVSNCDAAGYFIHRMFPIHKPRASSVTQLRL